MLENNVYSVAARHMNSSHQLVHAIHSKTSMKLIKLLRPRHSAEVIGCHALLRGIFTLNYVSLELCSQFMCTQEKKDKIISVSIYNSQRQL